MYGQPSLFARLCLWLAEELLKHLFGVWSLPQMPGCAGQVDLYNLSSMLAYEIQKTPGTLHISLHLSCAKLVHDDLWDVREVALPGAGASQRCRLALLPLGTEWLRVLPLMLIT